MEILFEVRGKALKYFGMWTCKDKTFIQKIIGILLHFLLIELMLFLQLMYLTKIENILDFTSLVSVLSTYVSFFVKAINLTYHIKMIEELCAIIKMELKNYDIDEKFKKRILSADKVFLSLRATAIITTFFGGFVPVFTHELAYKMWIPFDENNPTLFWIAAIYQHVVTVIGSIHDAILEMSPVFFMIYVIAMLEQLCSKLENINKQRSFKKKIAWIDLKKNPSSSKVESYFHSNHDTLKFFVCRHRQLIDIKEQIESIFNLALLVRGFTSTFVFCTSTFTLTMVRDSSIIFRITTYIISTFLQLLIPCYYGNEISVLTDRLSTSLFYSKWYLEEDKKYRKSISIFMERLKRKERVKSGKVFDVNLESFMRVCNSAFSLYAVFRNIKF